MQHYYSATELEMQRQIRPFTYENEFINFAGIKIFDGGGNEVTVIGWQILVVDLSLSRWYSVVKCFEGKRTAKIVYRCINCLYLLYICYQGNPVVFDVIYIPWASISPGPLKYIEMSTLSCMGKHICTPWAFIPLSPMQDIEVSTISCIGAHYFHSTSVRWLLPIAEY